MNLKDKIKEVKVEDLIPYQNNPKQHPQKQIDKIASSIKKFGFKVPMLVTEDNEIIAGHGRLQAARKLDMEKVPVIVADDLSKAQVKAFRLADNRIAESDWNADKLAVELEELEEMDFDLEETGFEEEEINQIGEIEEIEELNEEPIENKDLEDIKILNLYAGIGGNRKLWGDKPQITAVEYNEEIAKAYQDFFPEDKVIVKDAHKFLLNNFRDYDFIWSSPPCPTHSKIRKNSAVESGSSEPVYPDMRLYQEILLLKGYFKGKYCIENVNSWYDPLIKPQKLGRHYFWSNFDISKRKINKGELKIGGNTDKMEKYLGFNLSNYNFPSDYPKQKILNNCVHPKIGKIILEAALTNSS